MQISQILEDAKQLKENINQKNDWQEQIEQLHIVVKQVSKWQKMLNRTFGKVEIERGDGAWHGLHSGEILDHIPSESDIRVNHAGILQIQTVSTMPDGKHIHYEAQLRVDDQVFLRDMLPATVQMRDPVYKLIEINITVTKESSVSESLRSLDERIQNAFTLSGRIGHLLFWRVLPCSIVGLVAYFIPYGMIHILARISNPIGIEWISPYPLVPLIIVEALLLRSIRD